MINQGFGILPNTILFDKSLSDKEKLLFVMISSLCAEKGYCRANNNYFADKLGITKSRISNWITSLHKKGYISIDIKKSEGNKRFIAIAENSKTYCGKQQEGIAENSNTPIAENSTHNNTNSNKIKNKIINKSITKKSLHNDKLEEEILNQGEQFQLFWKTYPNGTSNGITKKIILEYYKRASDDEKEIIDEVKLLNRKLELGLMDSKYVKSCNNWIISFKPTTKIEKEQNFKKMIYALMENRNPELAIEIRDFMGYGLYRKFVKEYNKEFNSIVLK